MNFRTERYRSFYFTLVLTLIAVLSFSANSILCRMALLHTGIDAISFTSVRLLSGAVVLLMITFFLKRDDVQKGSWVGALLLFLYAAGFSLAYTTVAAGTGALLLFGSVQVTMICHAVWRGERLGARKSTGLFLAFSGLVLHFSPDVASPPIGGSLMMLVAGIAWGGYSILGGKSIDPVGVTTGNFLRAIPLAMFMSLMTWDKAQIDGRGTLLAVIAGGVTSALGYTVWYFALPRLKAFQASAFQLSVPVVTAFTGALLLGETLTLKFGVVCTVVLAGIALVVFDRAATV